MSGRGDFNKLPIMQDIFTHNSLLGIKTIKISRIANFQSWKFQECQRQMKTEQEEQK